MKFRDVSISRKLIVIIMLTTTTALALSSVLFLQYDRASFQARMIASLDTLVETLNPSLTNALALSDRRTAQGLLNALATDDNIMSATIFDAGGAVFSRYVRPGYDGGAQIAMVGEHGHALDGGSLVFSRPMRFGTDSIGTFQLRSDLTELEERWQTFSLITLGVFLATLLIALVLATYLQRYISRPVKDLAQVARHVSENNDYSVRASEHGRDELGRLVHAFNHMLTQIQIQHEQVRIARDRAEQANQSKSTFLANMSHELRTPLNAIIGYSELLQEEAEDDGLDEFVADLKKIVAAGKHLLSLINQVLDLSKVEAGKMDLFIEEIEIEDLVKDVASTIAPLVDKNGNRLQIQVSPGIGRMRADETKIRQMLFNLLSNASKFTEQGTIFLEAGAGGETGRETITFRIRDTGIGMTPDQAARIFQPFAQADNSTTRKYGGTGLGLAICKQFAELMGGEIGVRSEYGKGSQFHIRLPREVIEPGEREKHGAENPARRSGEGRKVGTAVIIDDDPAVHEVLGRILSRSGFSVVGEVDPERAVATVRAASPDLVLLDVRMPVVDGWQVLAALKQDPALSSIPVIMVTMLDERKKAFALGAEEFLSKPIDREKVARILDRLSRTARSTPPCALVIEDDVPTREILVRNLESEGWQALEAGNGIIGLKRLSQQRPDLILLDLMMPQMDGFGFLVEMRKNDAWRGIPIVVLTAMDLSNEDRARLNGRVAKVIEKGGYSLDELERELRSLTRSIVQRGVQPA